jgi:hypothetical protein
MPRSSCHGPDLAHATELEAARHRAHGSIHTAATTASRPQNPSADGGAIAQATAYEISISAAKTPQSREVRDLPRAAPPRLCPAEVTGDGNGGRVGGGGCRSLGFGGAHAA